MEPVSLGAAGVIDGTAPLTLATFVEPEQLVTNIKTQIRVDNPLNMHVHRLKLGGP